MSRYPDGSVDSRIHLKEENTTELYRLRAGATILFFSLVFSHNYGPPLVKDEKDMIDTLPWVICFLIVDHSIFSKEYFYLVYT